MSTPNTPVSFQTRHLQAPPTASPPESWLWPRVLPADHLTLLAGPPGIGKSFIALDLAARVSSGAPFPFEAGPQPADAPPTPPRAPANVLLFAPEDHPQSTIAPRLAALNADLSRIHLVTGRATQPDSADPLPLEAAVAALIETALRLDIRGLIVIDPFAAFLGAAASNAGRIRAAFDALSRFARERHTPILAIAHTVPGRNAGTQRILGPAILSSFPRTILQVEHTSHARTLFPVKSNLANPPAFSFSIESGRSLSWLEPRSDLSPHEWQSTLQLAERPRFDGACALLIAELSNGPREARAVASLAANLGIKPRTLQHAREYLDIRTRRMGYGSDGTFFLSLPPIDSKIARAHAAQYGLAPGTSPEGPRRTRMVTLSDVERSPAPSAP